MEQVADSRAMSVAEVAAEFGVSEMTVRRDIRRLEEEGFVRRTYGGAIATGSRPLELAVDERTLVRTREKRLIGMTMARLLGDKVQSLFIGAGSTTQQFAQFVVARDDVSVITPSVPIAVLLASRRIRVTLLGGLLKRGDLSLVGPVATQSIDRYRFDLAVIGTAALSVEEGIFDLDDETADLNRLAIRRAHQLVVLADSSKFGSVAWANVAPRDAIHRIVTDEGASADDVRALREAGVDVFIADPATAIGTQTAD